jgi:hypothetical protein
VSAYSLIFYDFRLRELWNAFAKHTELMEIPKVERGIFSCANNFRDDFIKLREESGNQRRPEF